MRLSQPNVSGRLVDRPRLLDELAAGLSPPGGSFVVLSAPAGHGKTVLLGQWMSVALAAGRAVGWCSLDRDDRDPSVFWESVLTAVEMAAPASVSSGQLVLPAPPPAGGFEPKDHRRFLLDIQAALEELGDGAAVILDDTHLLAGSPAEDEFRELLELCPANAHLAFATRTSLPDQRARLVRRVHEIDAKSLLFTRSETAELFDGFAVAECVIDELFRSSEGWPAVLGLALPEVALPQGAIPTDVPAASARELLDPDVLYEYFQREIFDQVDPQDQPTLFAFAICPVLSADLADAILQQESSAISLRRLARNNPMLRRTSTDSNGRSWYRVNPLYAEFLREKLISSQPGLLRRGGAIAVAWHLEWGDPRAALRLAAELAEPELLHSVMRRVGCELIADGHSSDLLALAATHGSALLAGVFSPLIVALAAVSEGKVERAEETMANAKPRGLQDEDALEWDWLKYVVAVRIALAHNERVTAVSSGWPDETISALPAPLRTAVHLTRGLAQTRVGEVSGAREELEASRATAESRGDLSSEVMSMVGLAATALGRTDLRQTLAYAERAVALAEDTESQDLSLALAAANILIAWGRFEMLDVAAAQANAELAQQFAAQQPLEELALQARHVYQWVTFDTLPDRRRVAQEFTGAWPPNYALQAAPSLVVPSLHAGLSMARALGEPRWTERLLERSRVVLGDGYDWQVASALVHYSMGRQSSARGILSPLLESSHRPRTPSSEIIAWSLDSVLEFESGNSFRAHEAMIRALAGAGDTGAFAEVLRSEPSVVRTVLARGLDRFGDHIPVAEQLIASGMSRPDSGLGHLTPKERELLAELKSLRTVAEISSDMLLSVNTVKTHMRGIYRKLNVSSRRRAVSEAERRGLL
ncbi:LuxR family maltose regulon positive regulatory protein [Glaciihabitans tibetensis]|uniref:LuxR family maltose regulon positive regulatory protein n=1 Tax=Glaciihabitans tibetensis TaxID=1266600 RepID=A0A2T0VAM3_9MICO|nr:LuxR C-terminal-related transcriptional regulator [Glaciihabitans tibetensis]PRY67249.1 LuxR family maltose regulon positive regulatory protein [Glaciihabitans tibetensis]